MPQIELKYSNNLEIDVRKIFESVEKIINKIDSSAGLCKSRAFPIKEFLHSHAFLTVSVLKKAHRDDVFMEKLLQALEHNLKQQIPKGCYYSVKLSFIGNFYLTSQN